MCVFVFCVFAWRNINGNDESRVNYNFILYMYKYEFLYSPESASVLKTKFFSATLANYFYEYVYLQYKI